MGFLLSIANRITPAYAGKSLVPWFRADLVQDHPRVCGEKCLLFSLFCRMWGSPPRMRGKVHLVICEGDIGGITPAYAGKSSTSGASTSAVWDHPRVCGEKRRAAQPPGREAGSPPRMRGKVYVGVVRVVVKGITPAYAGKSKYAVKASDIIWDHPRVCGEKCPCLHIYNPSQGSPPRMRGKVCWSVRCSKT